MASRRLRPHNAIAARLVEVLLRCRRRLSSAAFSGGKVLFALKSRKDKIQIVVMGVASFMAIFPLCAWRHLEIIEKDLLERSEEALAAQDVSGVEIDISGRDLLISAAAPGVDLEEARALLNEVYGVRVVSTANGGAAPGDQP